VILRRLVFNFAAVAAFLSGPDCVFLGFGESFLSELDGAFSGGLGGDFALGESFLSGPDCVFLGFGESFLSELDGAFSGGLEGDFALGESFLSGPDCVFLGFGESFLSELDGAFSGGLGGFTLVSGLDLPGGFVSACFVSFELLDSFFSETALGMFKQL